MKNYISDILKEGKLNEDIVLDRDKLSEFLKLSRNNEILYYALSLMDNTDGFISKLKAEEETLSKQIVQTVTEVTEVFCRKGLKFFPMKTFRSYPYTDDDIDIVMVNRERARTYIDSLQEIGYSFRLNRSVLREPGKRFYVKRDSHAKIKWLKIHLHFCVSWNGIEFLDAAKVWERLRTINILGQEIRVPGIEDELLIISAHAIHENSYITIGELLHLRNLFFQVRTIDTEYMFDVSKRYNWSFALRCYFLYADLYYRHLTGEYLLNQELKQKLNILDTTRTVTTKETFPYFLPVFPLLGTYANKIMKDFYSLNFCKIPREVLSFGVISWLLRLKNNAKFAREY